MKFDLRQYLTIGLSLLICVLVFLVNLILPLGVAVWLAYLAVIAAVAWSGHRRLTYIVAGVATLFIIVGFFTAPAGVDPRIAAVNRAAGIVLIWFDAFLIVSRRQLLLSLQLQAEELAAANAQLEEQADQLATANELLQYQAEELEVQAEELQAQNEELMTWTETLEQRVQERTTALRKVNASLQDMSARLTAVQENERRAISRELHDESGQLLTTLMIRLGLAQELCRQGESPLNAIDEAQRLANHLAEALHRLAVNLRPASLDRSGLIAALKQYIESYRETYNVQVDFAVNGFNGDRLPPELESALYRIIQEALTNAARHARANRVSVVLNQRPDMITSVIEDDGIGFDLQAAARSGRLGLVGMQERVELRGGSISIESQPGSGTTVLVEIPCPPYVLPSSAARPSQVSSA